jgi:proline iminopeptidase
MEQNYFEKLNGTKLHFLVRGENPKNPYLLALHGGPGFSAHMFYPWGKSLEKRLNVVYLDQRGCGESERLTPETQKTFTVKNLLADLEAVREFLKIKNWYVLGHSWGGMLGLEYAAMFPNKIAGLMVMDGLLSQPMSQDAIFRAASEWVKKDLKSTDKARIERGKQLEPYLAIGPKLPAGPQRMMSAMQFAMSLPELYYANLARRDTYQKSIQSEITRRKLTPSVLYANEPAFALVQNDNYATRTAEPLLSKISVRTLVLHGKNDGVIPIAHGQKVAQGIRGAKLIALNNCGHFPFAEQPEKTTRAILEFAR